MMEKLRTDRKGVVFILFFLFVLIFLAVLTFRLLSGEDNWICQNGQWVKHGNPKAPMPSSSCPKAQQSQNAGAPESNVKTPTADVIKNIDPVQTAQKLTDQIPNSSPVNIGMIKRGLGFFQPVYDISLIFGTKFCKMLRPKDLPDNCDQINSSVSGIIHKILY